MNEQAKFLAEIEAFMDRHDMLATDFGRRALKDFAFVSRMRAGRNPSLRTVSRCRQFMHDYERAKKRRKRPLAQAAA